MKWRQSWTKNRGYCPEDHYDEAFRRAAAGAGLRRIWMVYMQGYGKTYRPASFFLLSEVGYSRATLPEGLIRVGNRLGGRLGECFINVGKKAQGPEGITFAAAWDEEVAGFLKETCLDKKEEELLLSFPGFTGFVDGQMQLISLEQFGKEIRRAEEKARKETESRKKAVLSVSMAGGLLIAILLI